MTAAKPLGSRIRARARSLEDLLGECEEAQQMAAERYRVGKHGDELPDPDVHAFLKAIEPKARLLGLLAPDMRVVPAQLTPEQLDAELEKRGLKLVKQKGAA